MKTTAPRVAEQTGDRVLANIQDNASQSSRVLGSMPFSDGVMSEVLTFAAGETKVLSHKLGRMLQGFIVVLVRGTAPAELYMTSLPSDRTVSIKSDTDVVTRLWYW